MKFQFILLIAILFLLSSCSKRESEIIAKKESRPILKVGLVADPQYADRPSTGIRLYRESLWKLDEAIDTFNSSGVDVVQTLGDVIDRDWDSFDSILPIYQKINSDIENYHVLGNHEFAMDPVYFEDLLERLSMPSYYYSYIKKGWRFIALDANDYAYYSNPLHNRDINQINTYYENTEGNANHRISNSAIGEEQQKWLIQELEDAHILNQKVIIYSHSPLRPLALRTNLWNDFEIIEIIENSSNVVAFINGHNHAGDYIFKNGIHYISMSGMVETTINSFGILEIYNDSLVLKGYGNQPSILIDN